MTLPNESDFPKPVGARVRLSVAAPAGAGEDIDAVVHVVRDPPRLVLELESGTYWTLTMETAVAAYLAGGLAHSAGVVFA